jgi:hypothetical protein
MLHKDWLHRKAQQHAHNEILAFLIMVSGMNPLMGGLVVALVSIGKPDLFSLMTQLLLNHSVTLGLILTVIGFSTVSPGFVLAVRYDREKILVHA